MKDKLKNILVTGANGYVGKLILEKIISEANKEIGEIIALDVTETPLELKHNGITYYKDDIRNNTLNSIFEKHNINCVIHLACVVTPSKKMTREFMFSIDVDGTKNVLLCCIRNKVERISIASSGAAYGYHQDNADWLVEEDELRGNYEFAYAYHKKIVEDELEKFRDQYPELKQFVFRIGTILGENVNNQITDLFKKPVVLGIQNSDTPFVFIWDQDLVNIFYKSLFSERPGIYNVAGDGAVKIHEIANQLNKRLLALPPKMIAGVLLLLKKMRLTQYGPEQVNFLRYRPVLSNAKLKSDFGYIPVRNSQEVFAHFLQSNQSIKGE